MERSDEAYFGPAGPRNCRYRASVATSLVQVFAPDKGGRDKAEKTEEAAYL